MFSMKRTFILVGMFYLLALEAVAEPRVNHDAIGIPRGKGAERVRSVGDNPIALERDVGQGLSRPAHLEAVLQCVARLIEEKRGGVQGAPRAIQLLNASRAALRSSSAMANVLSDCEGSLREMRPQNISRDEQLRSAFGYGGQGQSVVRELIRPRVTCYQIGSDLIVGLVVSGSISSAQAVCLGSDGRQWVGVSVGGAVGFGVGAQVVVNGRRAENLTGEFVRRLTIDGGLGLTFQGVIDQNAVGFGGVGLGIGAGSHITWGRDLQIRLLPLPRDWSVLIARLLEGA